MADQLPSSDHDTHWKELITRLFPYFLAFFMPDIYAVTDLNKGVEFLDKELHKLIADKFKGGNTLKDKLAKIYLKDGSERWILIHIEIQSSNKPDFLRRMFVYFYRIFDRKEERITAFALYTSDDVPKNYDRYEYDFMGTKAVYQFNTYLIKDANEQELIASDNPFALAVLAAKYLNETKDKMELRYAFKHKLMDLAFKRGWTDEQVDALLQFIYLLIILPDDLETKFEEELLIKYNIMDTATRTTVPIIEKIMKNYRLAQAEAVRRANVEAAKKMLKMTDLKPEQIAEIQELTLEAVVELQKEVNSES